jgi:hypothetical protein
MAAVNPAAPPPRTISGTTQNKKFILDGQSISMIANLILNPNGFFENLKQGDVSLKKPFLIIIVLSAIGSINQYLILDKLSQAFPAELSGFLMIGAYIGIFSSFITILVVWLVITAIMYAISSILGGQGSFKRTFEFTGYGFLPSILASIITTPVTAYYIFNARVPELSMADVQNRELMKNLMKSLMPTDVIYFNLIVGFAFAIWNLTIWTFAIKNARELTTKSAIITVLIPSCAYIVYIAYATLSLL